MDISQFRLVLRTISDPPTTYEAEFYERLIVPKFFGSKSTPNCTNHVSNCFIKFIYRFSMNPEIFSKNPKID